MRGHHPAHAHCRSRFRVKGVYEVSSDLSRREMCRVAFKDTVIILGAFS